MDLCFLENHGATAEQFFLKVTCCLCKHICIDDILQSAYCLFIFGAGFRSRVRYINVLDPTRMSFYVSEILDAGRNSPLFMVN